MRGASVLRLEQLGGPALGFSLDGGDPAKITIGAIGKVFLDIEVHGIAAAELEAMLGAHFDLDAVGRSFGVLKLRGVALDVSLPRTESKAGLGHKGFLVQSDPHLGIEAAARRRDFPISMCR